MKKLLLILITAFTLSCCNKDDDNCQGIDCLPTATQTGAGTFGCLVNGEPFVDKSGSFNCFYQLVNGEYNFGIQSLQKVSNVVLIGLGSNASNITVNVNIPFNNDEFQNFYAGVNLANLGGTIKTSNLEDGFINFTKLDFDNNIVSATFEFSVIDPNTGVVYNITNGRFDSFFTE